MKPHAVNAKSIAVLYVTVTINYTFKSYSINSDLICTVTRLRQSVWVSSQKEDLIPVL